MNDPFSYRLQWAERVAFALGMLVLVGPVFSHRFHFTTDGPAHVYNASLILQKLTGSIPGDAGWDFTPVPVPNWLGHALLALLLIPFETPEASKALHVLILAGLPIALRALALQRGPGPPWRAHLIFPFAVHVPFAMGYYNFCLGLLVFVLFICQWYHIEAHANATGSTRRYVVLASLLVLLYLAHLVPFGFALGWLGIHSLFHWAGQTCNGGTRRRELLRSSLRALCACLPALVLLVWYQVGQQREESWGPPTPDRWEQLSRPFQLVDFPAERSLWGASVLAVLMALAQGLLSAHQQERRGRIRVFEAVIVGVALLLQATLPNFWGKGIDILMRLALITHLCVLFWVLALPQRRSSSLWIPFMVLPIMIMQQQIRGEEQERNNERMRACHAVAMRVIPGGSVAIVSFDWLGSHLPELAFADRNVLNLSNYEFINPHFPLRWSDSTMTARAAAPEHPLDVLEPWSNVPGTRLIAADHILVIGPPQDDAQRQALDLLRTSLRGTHPEEEGDGNYRLYSRANGQFNSETRISKASIGTARSVPFQK
ncbi:MAG: hypothetical protein IPG10_03200 [Flavobacteriales bacterium]|jgi:hypothetical protein|nr:hypothetical protein [Flavobacteriales bacterium]MBK6753697.1 hypothetical protein [Flavobacteriales bacterium]MBK7751165.1 hypothetical protein [Flavobacteriales bacterium]MBK9073506.1 hypothetical protein [Flavobacteriales bacterium]MBK9539191.1 hypothetical protein [Flavobacteriales bacterium]